MDPKKYTESPLADAPEVEENESDKSHTLKARQDLESEHFDQAIEEDLSPGLGKNLGDERPDLQKVPLV